FDPDQHRPTPLVELPKELNPFFDERVHIYVKLHSTLPAGNVKSLPALNMFQQAGLDAGTEHRIKRIVEYSSGSTVISMAMLAHMRGIDDVSAFLSNKTSSAKLKLMRFFGLRLRLFGGPSQPEPLDPRGGIAATKQAAVGEHALNPDQYSNPANYGAHERWTGPQLARQLPEMDVFVAGMGTAGTMTGTGLALKRLMPRVTRVGVTTQPGDRVPGPRAESMLKPVEFPWRDAIDAMEWVTSPKAYARSLELCRYGLLCGPSSGFNLEGLLQFLRGHQSRGTLDSLRASPDAPLHAVFIACDGPYQYIDEYFDKCPADAFPPIENEGLIDVDRYRYDDAWELGASDAPSTRRTSIASSDGLREASSIKPRTLVLDLRSADETHAIAGSVRVPLASLTASTLCPFADAAVLARQWRELDELLDPCSASSRSQKLQRLLASHAGEVLLVCYGGGTARVASSVLRQRGHEAFSLAGGMRRWQHGSWPVVATSEVHKGELLI
ncbi:putative cysteine synthase B, partial [Tilletiopsis washingtonensis]